MNNVQKIVKGLGMSIEKNSPTILIGLGVSGFVGSIFLAVEATPKAMDIIEAEKYRVGKDHHESVEFTTQETVQLVWPLYVPTAATALLSATAIFLGNKIHLRRTAALASLYAIAEDSLRTYQAKVLEKFGEKKAGEISGEVAQAGMDGHPVDLVHNLGGGTELAYEMFTGRYFMSDVNTIKSVFNKFNEELLSEDTKSLNELYYDLGLPSVELGDVVGWRLEDGLVDYHIGSRLTIDQRPCLTIDMINRPRYFHAT